MFTMIEKSNYLLIAVLSIGCLLSLLWPQYSLCSDEDVSKWQELEQPQDIGKRPVCGDTMVWLQTLYRSGFIWRVAKANSLISAKQITYQQEEETSSGEKGPELQTAVHLHSSVAFRGTAYRRIDDGWLVGFDAGEFGGGLYWTNENGSVRYEISDHHIKQFVKYEGRLMALAGLAHLDPRGSLIALERVNDKWGAKLIANLKDTPTLGIILRDGRLLISLFQGLATYSNNDGIRFLLQKSPVINNPNSMVLDDVAEHVYIGMRSAVGQYHLKSGVLRLLLPERKMPESLPKAEQDKIRCLYSCDAKCD